MSKQRTNFLPLGTILLPHPEGMIIRKKYVRYKEGAQLLSVSQRIFEKWAWEAGAVIKRDKVALVDLEKFDEYLKSFRVEY